MLEAVDLALSFGAMFLQKYGQKLPAEVVTSVQAGVDALMAHKADLLTKANFEANRG